MADPSLSPLQNSPYQFTFSCSLPTGNVTYTTEIPNLSAQASIQWPTVGQQPPGDTASEHAKALAEDARALLALMANSHLPTTTIEPFLRSYLQLASKLRADKESQIPAETVAPVPPTRVSGSLTPTFLAEIRQAAGSVTTTTIIDESELGRPESEQQHVIEEASPVPRPSETTRGHNTPPSSQKSNKVVIEILSDSEPEVGAGAHCEIESDGASMKELIVNLKPRLASHRTRNLLRKW